MTHSDQASCTIDFWNTLAPAGQDAFVARLEGDGGPAFGGDTLACCVVAASRSCEGKHIHSLHARFLRPLTSQRETHFEVERVREGRLLAHRRVQALQGDRLLLDATACFAAEVGSIEFQEARPDSGLPEPDALPDEATRARENGWDDYEPDDVDLRWPAHPPASSASSDWSMWAGLRRPLSERAASHAGALAWLSDVQSDWAVCRKLPSEHPRERFLSLDHVIWFHRPPRWAGWLQVRSHSPVAHASRALTQREIFDHAGQLIASVSQEAYLA